MSELIPFEYEDTPVRVIEVGGEPWFVLADLLQVLDIARKPSAVIERLDDDVRQTYPITDSLGRKQRAHIVSEPGMYDVIVRSDSPKAKPFRRWITTDVIPSIRKTGAYGQKQLSGPALYLAAIEQATAEIEALKPKAEAFDGFLGSQGDYSLNEGAKLLARNGIRNIGQNKLRDILLKWGWLYRGRSQRLRAKQAQIDLGRMSERTSYYYDDRTGEKKTGQNQAVITSKGLFAIKERLSQETGFIVIEGEVTA